MKLKKLTCDYTNLASFILRVGLAVPFLFAAIDTTLQPEAWIGFMPLFLQNLFPKVLLLGGFSLYEVALSVWLLSGWPSPRFSSTVGGIRLMSCYCFCPSFSTLAWGTLSATVARVV